MKTIALNISWINSNGHVEIKWNTIHNNWLTTSSLVRYSVASVGAAKVRDCWQEENKTSTMWVIESK